MYCTRPPERCVVVSVVPPQHRDCVRLRGGRDRVAWETGQGGVWGCGQCVCARGKEGEVSPCRRIKFLFAFWRAAGAAGQRAAYPLERVTPEPRLVCLQAGQQRPRGGRVLCALPSGPLRSGRGHARRWSLALRLLSPQTKERPPSRTGDEGVLTFGAPCARQCGEGSPRSRRRRPWLGMACPPPHGHEHESLDKVGNRLQCFPYLGNLLPPPPPVLVGSLRNCHSSAWLWTLQFSSASRIDP